MAIASSLAWAVTSRCGAPGSEGKRGPGNDAAVLRTSGLGHHLPRNTKRTLDAIWGFWLRNKITVLERSKVKSPPARR